MNEPEATIDCIDCGGTCHLISKPDDFGWEPGQIVVCAGYSQATRLLFAVLAERGMRRVGLEDPSLTDHWEAAAHAYIDDVIDPRTTREAVRTGIEFAWGSGPRVSRART